MTTRKVYTAIAQVMRTLAKEGIAKDRKNEMQGYKFRGIDDVYNALAPALADANLCVLPQVLERECVERQNAKGTALFYVTVKVDFAFVSTEDGSDHHVVTYGEAMDSGDKATNKAMSAAYKYAAMQAFCIPTEGDNDADAQTHEVKARAHGHIPAGDAKAEAWDRLAKVDGEHQFLKEITADLVALLTEGRDDDAYGFFRAKFTSMDADEQLALQYAMDQQLSKPQHKALKEAGERYRMAEAATKRQADKVTRGATPQERAAAA